MGARLNKTDWIEFGLKELEKHGHQGLRAQILAKKLGVSRGSFYWHFSDIAEYEVAVLTRWRDTTTEKIIEKLKNEPNSLTRMEMLVEMSLRPSNLERAIRSWAITNTHVANVVAEIDGRRYKYLEDLLKEIGVNKSDAEYRALILYWASIGRAFVENSRLKSLSKKNVTKLITLMSAS